MISIEQVEKLRKYGDITFEEAKKALEDANGNILDAVIALERAGKIKPPEGSGQDRTKNTAPPRSENASPQYQRNREPFSSQVVRFLKWCGRIIHKGNTNTLEVAREDEHIMSIPATVLVLLMLFCFWFIIPLAIVGMFFSYRYTFRGPEFGREAVNRVVNSAAEAAENIKKSVNDTV